MIIARFKTLRSILEESTMNLQRRLITRLVSRGVLFAVLLISPLLLSNLTRAGDERPFKATFQGVANAPTESGDPDFPTEIVVPLQGRATHLGNFDERLVHHINLVGRPDDPAYPDWGKFHGYAEWTAADGSVFTTDFEGRLYTTGDPDLLTFEVTHTIRPGSGTGRFEGASGSFRGVDGLFNVVTGDDQGGYLGTISN
jgi:hypothetical protein